MSRWRIIIDRAEEEERKESLDFAEKSGSAGSSIRPRSIPTPANWTKKQSSKRIDAGPKLAGQGVRKMQTYQPQTLNTNVGQAERYISIVMGVFLLLTFVRRSLFNLVIGIAGAYLLQRGMTGHCVLYSALGIKREGEGGQHGIVVRRAMTVN